MADSTEKLVALAFSLLLVSAAVVGPVNLAGVAAASGNTDATLSAAGNTGTVDSSVMAGQTAVVPTTNASGTPQLTITDINGSESTVALEATPEVLGPATTSLWGDSTVQVPYVGGNTGALNVVTADGTIETVVAGDAPVTPKASKSTLAVGRWNTSTPVVLFADSNKDRIYRVASNGTVTAVADPDNGVQAVVGVGDIDGDGSSELVFADGSQAIRYVERTDSLGQTYSKAYDGAGSNNGVGVGAPADFDGDGTATVPIVDGSNQVRLVDADGIERTLTGGIAKKSPVAPGDVDGDDSLEVVFPATNGNISYVDGVTGPQTVRTLVDGSEVSLLGNGLGVAFASGAAGPQDTDKDGVPDGVERDLGTNVTNNDTDGDGISDGVETNGGKAIDTDGDGRIDALDLDSDGDRIVDSKDGLVDTDGDGTPNYRDSDDDGDGLSTLAEYNGTLKSGMRADVDQDGTENWLDADADGDGTPDGVEGRSDADGDGVPDFLDNDEDNDGLPGYYERNVTGTDPTNNDSDASRTTANESGDLVLDGLEDFDDDGLTTLVEYRAGLDPFDNDTDGDGLEDGFERSLVELNASNPDVDSDGTLDGADHFDRDGLNNSREAALGTLLTENDTDGDGLDDGNETKLGTDPLQVDTDSDGLSDAEELTLPTDPTVADTDGDGTVDGNETFTATAAESEADVRVKVESTGRVASDLSIEQEPTRRLSTPSVEKYSVSPIIHLQSSTPFESATVTLGYNESRINESGSQLAVARYNRSKQRIEILNSSVDRVNNTLSTTTSHFSYYWIVDVNRFETQFERSTPNGSTTILQEDFDGPAPEWTCRNDERSGGYSDTPTKGSCTIGNSNATIIEETNRMRYYERTVTLPANAENVTFRTDIWSQVHASWSQATVELVIEGEGESVTAYKLRNRYYGGTRTEAKQVEVNVSEFAGENITISYRVDGRHTYEYENTQSEIKVDSVSIFHSGRGPGGGIDSDGDGLSDRVERGFKIWNGETVRTDPYDPDTDGDGLSDGAEVGKLTTRTDTFQAGSRTISINRTYRVIHSNPLAVDSDRDGLSDSTEVEGWKIQLTPNATASEEYLNRESGTEQKANPDRSALINKTVTSDPLAKHSDSDGLPDGQERTAGTDPRAADTDDDKATDSEELEHGAAPTLFDHRAPTVEVFKIQRTTLSSDVSTPKRRTSSTGETYIARTYHYSVVLSAKDTSGIHSLRFSPDCSNLDREVQCGDLATLFGNRSDQLIELDNQTRYGITRIEFNATKAGQTEYQAGSRIGGGGYFLSPPVNITATDRHDNSRREKYVSPGTVPQLTEQLAEMPITNSVVGELAEDKVISYSARQNGRLWGLRQTYLDLLYLATHPQSLVTGLTELPKLPKALANLPQATYQYQDRHNPFEKSEAENYALYGGHWVTGYVEGVLGGEVLLSKGVGKVSKVGKVQRVTDAVRGAKIASKGWAFRRSVRMAAVVSKKGPDATAARRVLDSVAVPKRVRVARQLGSERVQTIASRVDDTVPNAATRVGRATVRTGDPGRRLLVYFKDFGKTRALRTYLTMKDRAAMQRTLARAYSEHPDVTKQDIGAALRRYDSLETRAQKRAMRHLWRTRGDEAVAATTSMDRTRLEKLLSFRSTVVADGGSIGDSADVFRRQVIDAYVTTDGTFPSDAFFSALNSMADTTRSRVIDDVATGDVPLRRLATNTGKSRGISVSNGLTSYQLTGDFSPDSRSLKGEILYPEQTEDLFARAAKQDKYGDASAGKYVDPDNPRQAWRNIDDDGDRAKFVEEKLTPYVLEKRYGFDILCVDTGCGTGANGIDAIAWDPDANGGDGELIIVESKWTSETGPASNTKLDGPREDTSDEAIQMTEDWIADGWIEARETDNIQLNDDIEHKDEIIASTDKNNLENAVNELIIERESYDRAYFYTSNSRNGKTISDRPSRGYYVDDIFNRVYHLKAGNINND